MPPLSKSPPGRSAVTVAMNVTDVPNIDVPPVDELTAVAVAALVTVWTKFADQMPVNTAVMVYKPTV